MELIRAQWAHPLTPWSEPDTLDEYEKTTEKHAALWGAWAKDEIARKRTAVIEQGDDDAQLTKYNLLNLLSFETSSGGTRPEVSDMVKLAPLLSMVLDFGPSKKGPQVENILVAVHAKTPLRLPKAQDDLYWLNHKAKDLWNMRCKCLFLKKYPSRIMHRCLLANADEQHTLAFLLSKMTWQKVMEPQGAFGALSDGPRLAVETATGPLAICDRQLPWLSDEAPAGSPATTRPEKASMDEQATPSPLPSAAPSITPPPVDATMGIPSMFCDDLLPEQGTAEEAPHGIPAMFLEEESILEDEDILEKAKSIAPRPVHPGAIQSNFGKIADAEKVGSLRKRPCGNAC